MADNPLAGLRIPSLRDVVDRVIGQIGIGTLDLGHPLQRERLAKYLEHALSLAVRSELERAIQAATERAVSHVFRVMHDAEYQEKRHKALARSRKEAAERRQQKKEAERQARMDYSRRHLDVSKATVQ